MKLNLLLTSDVHGYIVPTNYLQQNYRAPFGLEREATYIKSQQRANPNTLTFDDGDYLEGSPLATYVAKHYDSPKPLDDAFNLIHYDYGIVGNHEFSYGQQYLKNSICESKRSFLCANITDQNGKHPFGKPYAITNVGGVNVGILGVTTQGTPKWELPSNIKGLHFASLVDTAKKYVPIMRKRADVVIVVYHGGLERDFSGKPTEILDGENEGYQLLKEVKGIDALLTGHQHRVIKGHLFGVPVIQVGHQGSYVGKITLDINNVKTVPHVINSQVILKPMKHVNPDPKMVRLIKPVQKKVDQWLNRPVAKVNGSLRFKNAHQARMRGCNVVNFVQNIQTKVTGADISAVAIFTDSAHGLSNPITIRSIMTNYVYPNKLALSIINGRELKAAIEQSAKYFDYANGQIIVSKAFRVPQKLTFLYDMYSGIDYVINVAKPIGHRVVKLTRHDKPVQPDQKFKIAFNNYRAVGGGQFSMFNKKQIVKISQLSMRQIIERYLSKHPVVQADERRNFKVIYKK